MRRVVLDANIYISALEFGGIAEVVVLAAMEGEFSLIASERIRHEVEKTFIQRFKWDAEHLSLLEAGLWSSANFVVSQKSVGICRDPKDNHLLETCWEARAGLLVSGDKDLLVLAEFQGTKIITLRAFADELSQRER